MILSENISYKQNASKNRSVIDLIKFVSIDIYNRIGFVRNLSKEKEFLRVYEVTMTQNLVYELIKFSKESNLNLLGVYESKDEKNNGSDILLCVKLSGGYIKIPVQAKILNSYAKLKNGNYKEFWHENKIGLQFNLLNQYAVQTGSLIALYLFYNYTENSGYIDKKEKECFYGCSYISTDNLTKKYHSGQNVVFGGIHPKLAVPFYKLFEYGNGNGGIISKPNSPTGKFSDIIDFYRKNGVNLNDSDIDKITFYSEEQIFSDERNWRNMVSMMGDNSNSNEDYSESNEFNPKYKIVLVGHPTVPDKFYDENLVVQLSPSKNDKPEFELA